MGYGDTDRHLARLGADALRLAAMKTLQHLELSTGWGKVALEEGQIHPGDPPLGADYEAHHRFTTVLYCHPAMAYLNIEDVVGEERLLEGRIAVKPGSRVVVLDPLDGSTQWALIRSGHSVAAMILISGLDGNLRLESAVVANPVHTFTLVAGEPLRLGATNGRSEDDLWLTSCLPESLASPSVAVTGYKTKDRGSMLAFLKEIPDWAFLTIGGNPVTPYVMAGDLTAAITWRSQFTWDAVGILMATQTDAVVGNIDGDVVNGPTFAEHFDRVVLTQNARVIQPMIVAKSAARFDELVLAIDRARDEFGPSFGTGVEELDFGDDVGE